MDRGGRDAEHMGKEPHRLVDEAQTVVRVPFPSILSRPRRELEAL